MSGIPKVPEGVPPVHARAVVYRYQDTGDVVYDSPDGYRPPRRWRFGRAGFKRFIEYSGGPKSGYHPVRSISA